MPPKQATKIGLSGHKIQTRALKFAEMKLEDFTAKKGQLYRYIQRYSLKDIKLHGEAG